MFNVLRQFVQNPLIFVKTWRVVRNMERPAKCYWKECPEPAISLCDECGRWMCQGHKISFVDEKLWLCRDCAQTRHYFFSRTF